MSTNTLIFLFLGFITFSLFSCKDDDDSSLTIPDSYNSTTFDSNTQTEYEIRTQLTNLTNEMKNGRSMGVTVDASTLSNLYNTGNTSLNSITISSYSSRMNFFFEELAESSGGSFDPTQPVNGDGGVLGSYLFEENGAELEQLVEKGLFGAAMYHTVATNIFSGDITLKKLDQALALFGANPSFPNSNNSELHENPDGFSATYAARRDDNSGNGFYRTIQQSFIKAQAAISSEGNFEAELNEAVEAILINWEKALMATVVNYCFSGIDKLSLTNPTPEDFGIALHALAEAVGFANGLKGTGRKQISDTTIDEILTKLRYPNDANISMHEFVKNPVQAVSDLEEVINIVQNEYNFSEAEIESYRKNWINEQQR